MVLWIPFIITVLGGTIVAVINLTIEYGIFQTEEKSDEKTQNINHIPKGVAKIDFGTHFYKDVNKESAYIRSPRRDFESGDEITMVWGNPNNEPFNTSIIKFQVLKLPEESEVYSYLDKNIDPEWRNLAAVLNLAPVTNLEPGQYKVKAFGNNGKQIAEGKFNMIQ